MGLFKLFKSKRNSKETHIPEPEVLAKIDLSAASESEGPKMEVEPELAIWLANGKTVKSLTELASSLRKMKASDYKEHVNPERNEIAEWVQEVLNNQELARSLRKAKGKMQAAQYTERELKALKKAAKMAKKAAHANSIAKSVESKSKGGKKQPMLEAAKTKVELPLELPQPETEKKWLWPFRKPKKATPGTTPEMALPEIPEFPETKMENLDLKFEPEPQHDLFYETKSRSARLAPSQSDVEKVTEIPEEPVEAKPMEEPTPEPQPKPRKQAQKAKAHREPAEDADLQRKMRELERQEKELNREEEELNDKRLDLTRRRYELIKNKGGLERERFEDFMKKHKLTPNLPAIATTEEQPLLPDMGTAMPDLRLSGAYGKERLQELLEQAKQNISQNNVTEAQKALNEVQSVLNTVFMAPNDKKQIEYEILEVEADLKLASLR